ncbi:MAG: protein-glutamate O-methyltransferase CheR [Opitutaceae bacterium]|nr:protein-glutamate O-methyltransferase CheR [Opitutaceae bacterium]
MLDRDFQFIREMVYSHSRIHLEPGKREFVSARLGRRLRATNLTSIGEYCRFLQCKKGADEISHLIDAISTNHTSFFRESSHFDFLTKTAVPEMIRRRDARSSPTIKVWCAACSTGEEPYSVAMTLMRALEAANPAWPVHIEATDISHRVLQHARIGVYSKEALKNVPAPLVRRFFQKGFGPQHGNYRVKSLLQEAVTFRQMNLLEGSPPFSDRYHLIFCRNVMIYFDRPTRQELVRRLATLLMPGGYLMVGHSESLIGIHQGLQRVESAVYRAPL